MSSYSEGQTHQLMDALERAGFTAQDVTKLGQCLSLVDIIDVVNGRVQIPTIIDCDLAPFAPTGLTVASAKDQIRSRVTGKLDGVAIARLLLHIDLGQQGGKCIKGNALKSALEGQSVLPANVLDYWLARPHLIPKECKGKVVFFWGTIYRRADGRLYVRFLYWRDEVPFSNYYWLGNDFDDHRPAAVLASVPAAAVAKAGT